jgi:meprin A
MWNFDKLDNNLYLDLGTPYDYRSVMHYRPFDYSLNGLMTLRAKKGEILIFRSELSPIDVEEIRKLYNCAPYKQGIYWDHLLCGVLNITKR